MCVYAICVVERGGKGSGGARDPEAPKKKKKNYKKTRIFQKINPYI